MLTLPIKKSKKFVCKILGHSWFSYYKYPDGRVINRVMLEYNFKKGCYTKQEMDKYRVFRCRRCGKELRQSEFNMEGEIG